MPVIEVVQLIEVPDVPDIDLPYDDGEPLESNWHRLQINVLGDALHQHWQERTDFFAGGNMFVYYSLEQARTRDYKGPDFFVVTGVDGSRSRHSWIVWQEGGRYPDVIVELLSPTTMAQDLGPKKDLYERVFRTSEYFCVNPDDWSLRGWHLAKQTLCSAAARCSRLAVVRHAPTLAWSAGRAFSGYHGYLVALFHPRWGPGSYGRRKRRSRTYPG